MGITKAPTSDKKADSLTPKKSNKNPVGILKKRKIMGKSKNVPAVSTPAKSAIGYMKQDSSTYNRESAQKRTGLY